MALKTVSNGNFYNLVHELEKGDTYKCFTVALVPGKIEGKDVTNISVINAETGEKQTLGTPGNIKYLVQEGGIEMGVYTEITRGDDRKYGKKMGSGYDVAQDNERTLSDAQFAAIPAADLSKAPIKKLTVTQVARVASELTAQVAGKK